MDSFKYDRTYFKTYGFRVEYPYCVVYNDKYYYFLNRRYKNLGNDNGHFITYPEIGESTTLYFYNSETRPEYERGKWLLLDEYKSKLKEFQDMATTKGLVKRTDFSNLPDFSNIPEYANFSILSTFKHK